MTSILISLGVSILAFSGWVGTILGLPGNWMLVVVAAALAWIAPADAAYQVSWTVVGILAALAAIGELIEFVAGAIGVGKSGGSKRAALLALVGSVVGAVVGLFVGIPIPVLGSLIGSLLFSGLGAAAGAIVGQMWLDKNWNKSVSVGVGAFWGRLFGTLGKAMCGGLMVAVLLVSVWS